MKTKEEIIEILRRFAVNETNEAGVKGDVIWDDDFEALADALHQKEQESLQSFAEKFNPKSMDADMMESSNEVVNEILFDNQKEQEGNAEEWLVENDVYCSCKDPQPNYPEMVWCEKCAKMMEPKTK